MFTRLRLSIILMVLIMSVAFAFPVFAGGWAVITLDELPANVVAGNSLTIGFTVLQHGKTPMADLDPTIVAQLSESESFVAHAKPDDKPGHYTATVTFPKEGQWAWSIYAFTMEQPMPTLNVAPAIAVSTSQSGGNMEPAGFTSSPLWIVRMLALVVGVVGLVLALKRNNRKALAVTGLCLVVGLGSFVTGSAVPEAEALSKPSFEAANVSTLSQEEVGQRLFVAKGCVTCHINSKVQNDSQYWTIDMGAPDLSNFSADPDYLDKWLFKPSALKPATKMPDLNLADDERAALIAFINSK